MVQQKYSKSFDNIIYFTRKDQLNGGRESHWKRNWPIYMFIVLVLCIMVYYLTIGFVYPWRPVTTHPAKIQHLFYFFHLHQAFGTLICEIATAFEVKTDPNGKNCNINQHFWQYYHNMDDQIKYMMNRNISFLANEDNMAKMGTFEKYHIRSCPNGINDNIPQIHFATILRDPRELLIAQYLAHAHEEFNEDDFIKYVKEKKFKGGSLIWRYSGDWCDWEKEGGPIVLSESRFEFCSEIAHKWLDMFEIVCFVDNMDLCIEYMIKNYFCKANDKHCKDVLNPLITKFQNDKFRKDELRVRDKTEGEHHSLLTWDQMKQSLFENQSNVLMIEDTMKYEDKLFQQMKAKFGNGKFEKYSTIAQNYGC